MDAPAIALRFGSYAVLSLIAGAPLFLWLACGAGRGGRMLFERRGMFVATILAAIGFTVLGFLAMVAGMTGEPLLPVDWDMAEIVLSATAAGKIMVARLGLLILMLPLVMRRSIAPVAILGMFAIATLAWGGHAAASQGTIGGAHMLADMIHLIAAATWIGGMACLLNALRKPDPDETMIILRAFAPIGSAAVGLLILTGVSNGVLIVGFDHVRSLIETVYGRLLILKLVAFAIMLLLAANNRFRLTPSFERQPDASRPALRRAVGVEIAIAGAILFLVGWLGMTDSTTTL